jgi:nucleotide-binding universal stress UspA family protein
MDVQNILIPIDFSPCSKNALKVAVELAARWEAHLHLLNVIAMPAPHPDISSHVVIEPMLAEYHDDVHKSFEKLEDEIPSLKLVNYHSKDVVGQVTLTIQEEIQSKKIDMVIMGTKGSHDRLERWLGSISSEVISSCRIPIMVIPENVSHLEIRKIGYAADFQSITMPRKLEIVKLLMDTLGAELTVFNVHHSDEAMAFDKSSTAKILKKVIGHSKFEFGQVAVDKIDEGIIQFVDEEELDMLVMMPHRHGLLERIFHGSMTKKIAMQLRVPLLAIHQ